MALDGPATTTGCVANPLTGDRPTRWPTKLRRRWTRHALCGKARPDPGGLLNRPDPGTLCAVKLVAQPDAQPRGQRKNEEPGNQDREEPGAGPGHASPTCRADQDAQRRRQRRRQRREAKLRQRQTFGEGTNLAYKTKAKGEETAKGKANEAKRQRRGGEERAKIGYPLPSLWTQDQPGVSLGPGGHLAGWIRFLRVSP